MKGLIPYQVCSRCQRDQDMGLMIRGRARLEIQDLYMKIESIRRGGQNSEPRIKTSKLYTGR